jgi:hypothetical protein
MTKLSDLGRPIIGHRHEGPPASSIISWLAQIAANRSTCAIFAKSPITQIQSTISRSNWMLRSSLLPKYQVEEMEGDIMTATHIVNVTTPIRAARDATERDVTLRTSEPIWMRVANEQRDHIFEFSFSL